MAESLELGAQLPEVVDLAAEAEYEAAVLGAHRLLARGRGVDYREAAVAQPEGPVREGARTVRAAMGDRLGHRLDVGQGGRLAFKVLDSRYPAHSRSLAPSADVVTARPLSALSYASPTERARPSRQRAAGRRRHRLLLPPLGMVRT